MGVCICAKGFIQVRATSWLFIMLWAFNRVAQLVARSTPDRCVVSSSPKHGTEHFGFPQCSTGCALHVQPRLYDWADPVPLIGKRKGLSPTGRFLPSFIHQVIIITGLNKLYNDNCIVSH